MRFELTRAEPIGLAVQRLNHSATQSCLQYVPPLDYLSDAEVGRFLTSAKRTTVCGIHNIAGIKYTWIILRDS